MDIKKVDEIRIELRAVEKEISKHRKLLNRAVGNHCIISIDYHHMEIVRLINSTKEIQQRLNKEFGPVYGLFQQKFQEDIFTKLDAMIINGDIQ